jgi:hypothetical protein
MKVYSYYQKGDKKKRVKKGFSWTMFFFGWFVPLFRGDFSFLILLGILDIGLFALGFVSGGIGDAGMFIINLIFAFNYNQHYCLKLERKGYKAIDKATFETTAAPSAPPAQPETKEAPAK